MANFRITAATSRLVTTSATNAFGGPGDDTAGADKLTVDALASLVAIGPAGSGAFLPGTGAWTVTVNGLIQSSTLAGMILGFNNPANSSITIGALGEVKGLWGLYVESSATIKNAGVIQGTDIGVRILDAGTRSITNSGQIIGGNFAIRDESASQDTLTNSGTITGDVDLGGGNNKLTNSGEIDGNIVFGGGNDTVTNSKVVGEVHLGDGTNRLTNSGTTLAVYGGNGADTIVNSKLINGSAYSGDGDDTVTNSGMISSAMYLGEGTNRLVNSGFIERVIGGSGNDTVTNSKTIGFQPFFSGVFLGDGINVLTNSGTIISDVQTGSGNDTVKNTGTITGNIMLFGGNDTFTGGGKAETVIDGDGADSYLFSGGNDAYRATGHTGADGNDTVDGGAGIDDYNAELATSAVFVNLDTVAHDRSLEGYMAGTGQIAANTGFGINVSGTRHRHDQGLRKCHRQQRGRYHLWLGRGQSSSGTERRRQPLWLRRQRHPRGRRWRRFPLWRGRQGHPDRWGAQRPVPVCGCFRQRRVRRHP